MIDKLCYNQLLQSSNVLCLQLQANWLVVARDIATRDYNHDH